MCSTAVCIRGSPGRANGSLPAYSADLQFLKGNGPEVSYQRGGGNLAAGDDERRESSCAVQGVCTVRVLLVCAPCVYTVCVFRACAPCMCQPGPCSVSTNHLRPSFLSLRAHSAPRVHCMGYAEGAAMFCQYYLRGAKGYALRQHLENIGSRAGKHWYRKLLFYKFKIIASIPCFKMAPKILI